MLSNRPYLLRAFHQWIVDSVCTPILVINANHPHCKIPRDYVESGEIVFNIAASAVRDLKMTNESIEFKASFSGVVHLISAPIQAILAIYAEENGEGIFFDAEDDENDGSNVTQLKGADNAAKHALQETKLTDISAATKSKPVLRLIE